MNIVPSDRNALWDPVDQLDRIRREIDEMFQPAGSRLFPGGLFDRDYSPAMDVVVIPQ